MKKTIVFVIITLLVALNVLASNSFYVPDDDIIIDPGSSEIVDYCIVGQDGNPAVGYYTAGSNYDLKYARFKTGDLEYTVV